MIPRRLTINGRQFRLRQRKLPDANGICDFDAQRIEYRPGLSQAERRDTVLHEVMHAIRYTQGREYGGEVEEDYVRSLATGLIGVLDTNPAFAAWLVQKD